MEPERSRQIEAIYRAALARPTEDRSAYLIEVCHGDQALQALVAARLLGAPAPEPAPTGSAASSLVDAAVDATHTAHSVRDLGDPSTTPPNWGEFHLLGELGRGGFGRVCRAWDATLQREVALKIIRVPDHTVGDAVLREGRMLARIRHPNVVTVYGAQQIGDEIGLWMELIKGRHLADVVQAEGVMSAEVAAVTGLAICQALAAVHGAGLLHRDIKAHNVMREAGGRIVLMDFGAGREAAGKGEAIHDVTGTPVYMAPELFTGQSASPASDLYSLGVLLFYLVTGQFPVEGKTLVNLAVAHGVGRRRLLADLRPDVPRAFSAVVERALSASPGARAASAGEMMQDLAESLPARHLLVEAPTRAASWSRSLAIAVAIAIGSYLTTIALGMVTSRFFNVVLDRSEFVREGPGDWLYWGLTASVAPLVILALSLLTTALLIVVRRLIVAVSTRARALDAALRTRGMAIIRRLRLDDVSTLSAYALFLSTVLLIVAFIPSLPLLGALERLIVPSVSNAPIEDLAWLSPAVKESHLNHTKLFIGITIACAFIWYPVLRLALRKREWPHGGLLAGGICVTFVAAVFVYFPYRLLYHNEFEVATLDHANCYIIGERADDVLLFCPELPPPRNRTVNKLKLDAERGGVHENIFSRLSADIRSRQ